MRTRRYRKRGGGLMDLWNGVTAKATELTEQAKVKAMELKTAGENQLNQAQTGLNNSFGALSEEAKELKNKGQNMMNNAYMEGENRMNQAQTGFTPQAGGRRRKSRRKRTRRR
jgi:hypothetical protein